ncbi:MAG: UDP-N-acetylglucosamine--N-acetylmuramyl-(pentapeptide) pyrophosphoryl-undecaprenol N-acetylglucosamine transferase [Elusimicrobia bacterium]|nr:UDP-N-acetylglucosamine--N-acetylmuramyl-(pentapeptide) pyrophosphoryl-undecaprenol N-acetylglucosamine transferase [Elusimicrobiota bacterium]
MRIIIAGGGTGGHFYPGYVMAKKFEELGDEVVFAVKKNDISIDLLKKDDITFIEIDMISMPRSLNPFKQLRFITKFIRSFFFSMRVMNDLMPDAVFGTGSYIAFPVIFASWFKKIPVFIHESNAIFGLGNKIAGRFAKKIFLGLPVKNNPFKNKSEIVGTPIRDTFFKNQNRDEIVKKFKIKDGNMIISCFGGSQGSVNINNAIYHFALRRREEKRKITLIHITGKKNFNAVMERYEMAGLIDEDLILIDYYENMSEIYEISDLIISRSGASTITELIYTEKPAILIPLSSSADDHQLENAKILSEAGSAIIVNDDKKLTENLLKAIDLVITQNELDIMKKSYSKLNIPKGDKTADIIIKSIKG